MGKLVSGIRAIVSCLVLTAAACGAGAPLPTATATLGWAHVSLPRGSYCWQSAASGTCADSAGTDALLRSGYLKPFRVGSGVTARVAFSSSPRHVHVGLISGPTGHPGNVAHAGATFDLPAAAGLYVYVVSGTWPEGTVDFFLPVQIVPGMT